MGNWKNFDCHTLWQLKNNSIIVPYGGQKNFQLTKGAVIKKNLSPSKGGVVLDSDQNKFSHHLTHPHYLMVTKFFGRQWTMGMCEMVTKKNSISIQHTPTIGWQLKLFDRHKRGACHKFLDRTFQKHLTCPLCW
jgi:hypothetical protein